MITNYSTLKTSIAAYLQRSDLTSMIPEFIADAESRIYTEMRTQAMETAYSATMVNGEATLPAGLIEWQWLYIDSDPKRRLEKKDMEWILRNFPTSTGKPYYFARNGDSLTFGPTPDADYALVGSYYKRLAALSDSNTTNWLTDDYPELIRFAALCEATPYLQEDQRIPVWEAKYQQVKQRIERLERREKTAGSRLTTTKG